MPSKLLKRFKSRRVTLTPESDGTRDSQHPTSDHVKRCWYKKPMFDFWQGLLAALERIAMLPSLIHSVLPSLSSRKRVRDALRTYDRTMDDLLREIQRLLEAPLEPAKLLQMSAELQRQFTPKLQASDICMLPSYNDKLPTGLEKGTYLALDVGGSTFRIALVELNGKQPGAKNMSIVTMKCYKIDEKVRQRSGAQFFDWMAEKIQQALADPQLQKSTGTTSFPMGLAWSFPVEQTSTRSANLLDMGKGFRATEGLLGQDLSELIMAPCRKRNLPVHMDSIVNDSSATLLSRAYEDPSTRFAVILGTGFNISVHLPVSSLATTKYKGYPQKWLDEATHVLVNTECSMFGKNIFPTTRWDDQLNDAHVRPDFQPFEHMISGRYLGEIVRLIIVEAVRTAGLFSGEMPNLLNEPYTLDTGTIAAMEMDGSKHLTNATALFQSNHSLSKPPTYNDIQFVRQISQLVSHRAAAFLATGIHALWALRIESEGLTSASAGRTSIGCNGSVIEKYPFFRELCQSHLDELAIASGAEPKSISLEIAMESAIFGAAVAACCLEGL
ncbi:actin-like ATPase domain-containing protein [Cucurbitaria berberidis CBS 394.84]|uniref:Phosphotransferase n=1 Tax=Cucurbitaria berberidis CBS 394.84 TaxID=1168544 RepID=A0A9P4GBF1_9PLEO|nr:actin-like ATPase domain-containing protein [Cucurbitaria berberidis CBS 394.84]KAF1842490.1 actin-like ATPase domain-containing protein [Cucurbitaria berberidis CBS 394.84]